MATTVLKAEHIDLANMLTVVAYANTNRGVFLEYDGTIATDTELPFGVTTDTVLAGQQVALARAGDIITVRNVDTGTITAKGYVMVGVDEEETDFGYGVKAATGASQVRVGIAVDTMTTGAYGRILVIEPITLAS